MKKEKEKINVTGPQAKRVDGDELSKALGAITKKERPDSVHDEDYDWYECKTIEVGDTYEKHGEVIVKREPTMEPIRRSGRLGKADD